MPPKWRSRRGRATPAGARSGPAPLGSHVRRNLVAYLALFVALGGTAAAAKPVLTGADIQDGSLSAADVAAANRTDCRHAVPPDAWQGSTTGSVRALSIVRIELAVNRTLGPAAPSDEEAKDLNNGNHLRARADLKLTAGSYVEVVATHGGASEQVFARRFTMSWIAPG